VGAYTSWIRVNISIIFNLDWKFGYINNINAEKNKTVESEDF